MPVLLFPGRSASRPMAQAPMASLEALLSDCRDRARRLRDEGRRLDAAVSRLRLLRRRMGRSRAALARSLRTVQDLRRSLRPSVPAL
jgi:hypothetical protein